MFTYILGWIAAALVINMITRAFLGKYVKIMSIKNDYLAGYLAGSTNTKMYYYLRGEIPSTDWLDTVKYKTLYTRELAVANIENI